MMRRTITALLLYPVFRVLSIDSAPGRSIIQSSSNVIRNVTIFGNIAQVERSFTFLQPHMDDASNVKLQEKSYATIQTLELSGLPSSLQDESIRITGIQGSDGEVLGVEIVTKTTPREEMPQFIEKLAEMREILEKVKLEASHLTQEETRYTNKIKTFNALVDNYLSVNVLSSSSMGSVLTLENIKELLQFQESELSLAYKMLSETQERLKRTKSRQASVEGSIESLTKRGVLLPITDGSDKGSSEAEETPTIYFPASAAEKVIYVRVKLSGVPSALSAPTSQPSDSLVLALTYMASSVNWSPEYDIRIDEREKSVEGSHQHRLYIDYYASVKQSTGEDWIDTKLSLSTNNPSENTYCPAPVKKGIYFGPPPAYDVFNKDSGMKTYASRSRNRMEKRRGKLMGRESLMMAAAPMAMEDSMVSSQALPEMDAAVAEGRSGGDLGASYTFNLPYSVSISSATKEGIQTLKAGLPPPPSMSFASSSSSAGSNNGLMMDSFSQVISPSTSTSKHRLLINKIELTTQIFTYAVPSQSNTAYLRGWGIYRNPFSSTESIPSAPNSANSRSSWDEMAPLLACPQARIFLQGSYSGTTEIARTQPYGQLRINLGEDSNTLITSTSVLPSHKDQEEDKSTWFVKDTKRYRVKTEEYIMSVLSTHASSSHSAAQQLVILSENLPKSTEAEIRVELLSPAVESLKDIPEEAAGSDEECIAFILKDSLSYLTKENGDKDIGSSEKVIDRKKKITSANSIDGITYFCKASGNIFWVHWLREGESKTSTFKYKIIWPEEKQIATSPSS